MSIASQAKAVSINLPPIGPVQATMTLPSSSLLSSRACGPKILVHNRSAAIGDSYPFPQIPRRRHQYDRLLEPTQMRRCLWRCCQRSSSASSSRIESGSRQWKQQQQPHPHTHPHPQPQQPSRLRRGLSLPPVCIFEERRQFFLLFRL